MFKKIFLVFFLLSICVRLSWAEEKVVELGQEYSKDEMTFIVTHAETPDPAHVAISYNFLNNSSTQKINLNSPFEFSLTDNFGNSYKNTNSVHLWSNRSAILASI